MKWRSHGDGAGRNRGKGAAYLGEEEVQKAVAVEARTKQREGLMDVDKQQSIVVVGEAAHDVQETQRLGFVGCRGRGEAEMLKLCSCVSVLCSWLKGRFQ